MVSGTVTSRYRDTFSKMKSSSQSMELHEISSYERETSKFSLEATVSDLSNDDAIALARSGKKEVLTVSSPLEGNHSA